MTCLVNATDESVGRIALRLRYFGCGDNQLQVKTLAQVEEHAQVVLGQTIRLVEEEQAESSERSLGAQKVGVALPGGQNHHHERRTDPDGLARGHPVLVDVPETLQGFESRSVTLEDRVRQSLAEDPERLADVLEDVLPHVAAVHRYVSVGRVTWQVAKEARPQSPRERDWKPILNDIEIEDWQLRNGHPRRSSSQTEGEV